jgi:hypothetical protein
VGELVARAKADGIQLAGKGGLLDQLTKMVVEGALECELTDHLGRESGERAEEVRSGNYRSGHRSEPSRRLYVGRRNRGERGAWVGSQGYVAVSGRRCEWSPRRWPCSFSRRCAGKPPAAVT